ncbi:MAG: S41 family peptidase [Glaciecola sp.]
MKSFIALFLLISVSINAAAQLTPEWVRYPAISPQGDTIAFTYKGDIYSVPASGGDATRLTFHQAHDYQPVWSHDGQHLAFASDRFGNFDVYVMPAQGGKATRLSYHSSNEEPYTFSLNNQSVIFKGQRLDTNAHRQHPTSRQAELYEVPVDGGRVTQVLTVPAEYVQLSQNGKKMIYQDNKGTENPWRKHHRSSITRDIWEYTFSNGKHKKLTDFKGEDRNPIYTNNDDSMYYLSEESGSFNVHKRKLSRSSSTQLTEFDLHPVRFLSYGNNTLAFGYHGKVYTMTNEQAPQLVNISIRTQDVSNHTDMIGIDGDISEMAVSHSGDEIAYIANGDVFVSSTDGAFTKQITRTAGEEAFVSFAANDEYIMYSAQRDSKWSVFKASKVREVEPFYYAATLIEEKPLIVSSSDNYLAKMSPNGKKIAYIEDRRSLKVLDVSTQKSITLVPRSEMIHMRDGDQHFSWSPDSQWILFQYDKLLNNADVALVRADGSESINTIVPSGYYDASPTWANDGKQIMWMSNRHGLKSYATSGRSQFDVYGLFLTQQAYDKFTLSEDDYNLLEAIDEANSSDESETDESETSDAEQNEQQDTPPIDIEFDGLEDRIKRFTIHSSNLEDAVLSADGTTLYYLSKFEDNYDLWETNLRTQETRKAISLGAPDGRLMWDANKENLYLLSDGSISTLVPDDGDVSGIYISEKAEIDRNAVRLHAFDHVWLRTAKIFYEPTYHGIDWNKMYTEYRGKVAHTANQYEFTELLSEMLGELNVSHSGAGYRGGSDNPDATASLGVFHDYEYKGNGIKITEVINGGPLDKAKFDVAPGMIINKINGEAITNNMDWAKLLNRKANKFTLLDIVDQQGKMFQITMKPISQRDLSRLLYKRFVKLNELEVLERSKGKLGYVHIPGMGDGPFRSIYNDMMGRFYNKKGMVVDTRFNGGGDLVADLAMFFTGESFLTYATEDKVVGGEPTSRYTKPVIALFNESMYSDGHCYASGYKDLNLGKSVGMPVPGTCSFAGWESLPLGGYWGVVPVSAKNKKGEWLENNQTPPDIEVRNAPDVVAFGRDQQLERAVKELLKTTR